MNVFTLNTTANWKLFYVSFCYDVRKKKKAAEGGSIKGCCCLYTRSLAVFSMKLNYFVICFHCRQMMKQEELNETN